MRWCRTFGEEHYELAVDQPAGRRLVAAFRELALAI
jgi:hypothetical protein